MAARIALCVNAPHEIWMKTRNKRESTECIPVLVVATAETAVAWDDILSDIRFINDLYILCFKSFSFNKWNSFVSLLHTIHTHSLSLSQSSLLLHQSQCVVTSPGTLISLLLRTIHYPHFVLHIRNLSTDLVVKYHSRRFKRISFRFIFKTFQGYIQRIADMKNEQKKKTIKV